MKRQILAGLCAVAALTSVSAVFPASASAWTRHATRHQHHRSTSRTRYFHTTLTTRLGQEFGMFPNIRYFERNGHVYYRNLDTGQVYLAQW